MKSGFAANAGSSPKKSANKKTTSPKSNPRAKSPPRSRRTHFLGGRTAAPPRRKTSRATNAAASPKKSANRKNNLTKIQSTRKIPPRSRGCTASSAVEQPLHPAGKQVVQRMRLHHQKKSANKKPNLTKIPSTRQIPTTEPRMHRILGGSNSRSNPQENKSRNECGFITPKNPQTKKPTSPKSHPRDKSPPRSRGCTASSAVEQPLHPAGKQVAQRMRVHNSKKSANKKKQPHKNPIHATNPHHGAAERSSSADHSRSTQQENKSRNECGCRCILQNREIC